MNIYKYLKILLFGRQVVASVVLLVFLFNISFAPVSAQVVNQLPPLGTRINLSPVCVPPLLKGVKIDPDNPFHVDFILDKGDAAGLTEELKNESTRLIKYFLASITVPEQDLWVNLSPYEEDNITPNIFGITQMGRDILAQDYILKQITASVIYPEEKIGKEFWDKVYAETRKRYGAVDVPVDTFNKVWIVPAKAVVYENKNSAYVIESRLSVLLEEDYLALEKGLASQEVVEKAKASNQLGSNIAREVLIPILEKEINEGKNFLRLRQVYHSLILALWFKDKIKGSVFGNVYVDQDKIAGVDIKDKAAKEKIWAQYVESFQKGAYNYIKEDYDSETGEAVPRKYFSGGAGLFLTRTVFVKSHDRSLLPEAGLDHAMIVKSDFQPFDGGYQLLSNDEDMGYLFSKQGTVSRELIFSGTGLHLDIDVEMRIRPAPVDTGIVFLRKDHRILANINNVAETAKATMLTNGNNGYVLTTEHVLSALGSVGVNNAYIELSEDEVPIFDGSVVEFQAALLGGSNVMKSNQDRELFTVRKPLIFYRKGEGVKVLILPTDKKELKLSYFIEFANPAIGSQYESMVLDKRSYWREIANCRTFIENKNLQEMQKMQRFLGIKNGFSAVLLREDGTSIGKGFVNEQEAIRHKILDLFGDLQLAPFAIYGHVIAIKAGHRDHNEMVKKIVCAHDSNIEEQYTAQEILTVIEEFRLLRDLGKIPESLFNEISFQFVQDHLKTSGLSAIDKAQNIIQRGAGLKGGIDLTGNGINLQGRRDGEVSEFTFDPAIIKQLQNGAGLTPIIINMSPMAITLPMFLGLQDNG